MAAAKKKKKAWESFEDVFRVILNDHKEYFGLARVEPGPAKAVAESGYVYNIEVLAYAKGDEKLVLFECRLKIKNLEPGHAGEFIHRISTTGAKKGYFVTSLEKGLSKGAMMEAGYHQVGHIQLSADATRYEYIMRYMQDFFLGVSPTKIGASASVIARDPEGNIIGER